MDHLATASEQQNRGDQLSERAAAIAQPSIAVLPPQRRRTRVEVEVPEALMGEFELMLHELLEGKRTRLNLLGEEVAAIESRALEGLQVILEAIRSDAGTAQCGRLVRFLAGLSNGCDYPFDFSDLQPLDPALASACLDYLNFDRLGVCEIEDQLEERGRDLQAWVRDYGITPLQREESRWGGGKDGELAVRRRFVGPSVHF
jgi:hypothetical protein